MPDETQRTRPRAEIVLSCRKLAQCVDFYGDLGFRLETIFPADNPRIATLCGHGLWLRLVRAEQDGGGHLRIPAERSRESTAPNGTRIEFFTATASTPTWQPATFVVSQPPQPPAEAGWLEGRAGMLYRDLITGRQDGWLIASLIRIPRGGPVPDYVHYHRVAAQVLYCKSGWVRVVYEDQGEPFVMRAGDCVLQPPEIRHRVLECSDELEVVEVSSPAEHETCVDHDMTLPTANVHTDRTWAGQRFVRHQASGAVLHPWLVPGFDARETGVGAATRGTIAARIVRPGSTATSGTFTHTDDRRFWFVLRGAVTLGYRGEQHRLAAGSACVLPSKQQFLLSQGTADLELFEVARNERL